MVRFASLALVACSLACTGQTFENAPTSSSSGSVTSSSTGSSGGGGGQGGATASGSGGGACAPTEKSCGGTCLDVSKDPANCGDCGKACTKAPNAAGPACAGGMCVVGDCAPTFADCNGKIDDGCEIDTSSDAANCGACGTTCGLVCKPAGCIDVVEVSAGSAHTCAILSDHTLWCWGYNIWGNLGVGDTMDRPSPTHVNLPAKPVHVSTNKFGARFHTCAVLDDGSVWCWGANGNGQLGTITPNSQMAPAPVPVGLPDSETFVAVSAGGVHSCALAQSSKLYCWGSDGVKLMSPVPVVIESGVKAVSAGSTHTCYIADNDDLKCFGGNDAGQIGDGTLQPAAQPQTVLANADFVASGVSHTCAHQTDGSLRCWGSNFFGQLGIGGNTDQKFPNKVALSGATAVTAGGGHTGAITGAGTFAWGRDTSGQLGDGMTTDTSTPGAALVQPSSVSLLSFGLTHSCAIAAMKDLWCWGDNLKGQVGVGQAGGTYSKPQKVVWAP